MNEGDERTHCVVVDTNVLAVAEGMHGEASDECRLACAGLLRRISDGQRVLVDADDEILVEYVKVLEASPRSGVGTKLAKSLWRRRHDENVCHRVPITRIDDPEGSFDEVPVALRDFDPDDQKFLAAAKRRRRDSTHFSGPGQRLVAPTSGPGPEWLCCSLPMHSCQPLVLARPRVLSFRSTI